MFALFAAFASAISRSTRAASSPRNPSTVDAEIAGLSGNTTRANSAAGVRDRNASRRPESSLYLVTTEREGLAGNIGSLAPGVLNKPGWMEPSTCLEEPETARLAPARAATPGGSSLVGRDLEERDGCSTSSPTPDAGRSQSSYPGYRRRRVCQPARAQPRRCDDAYGADHMAGVFRPSPGRWSGDELDRLIQPQRHAGAHRGADARLRKYRQRRTRSAYALTRLRNPPKALRTARTNPAIARRWRQRSKINGLIRAFNALLMIARARSGEAREMSGVDAAEVAPDVTTLSRWPTTGLALRVRATSAPSKATGSWSARRSRTLSLMRSSTPPRPSRTATAARSPDPGEPAGAGGRRISCAVRDGGPGIPESDRAHVVERFVRLEQSRTKPGSGLGLSLAAAVARLHGGELKLEDNAPGLKAILDLPRVAA